MKNFVKYKNYWYEYNSSMPKENTTIYNDAGKRVVEININNYETATAESLQDLNWENTLLYSKEYNTGWVSPEGVFYGCDYRFHGKQAMYLHKTSERDLEQLGWVKISYLTYYETHKRDLTAFFASPIKTVYPSMQQINYVRDNYKDPEKTDMVMSLFQIRLNIINEIKNNWGLEK